MFCLASADAAGAAGDLPAGVRTRTPVSCSQVRLAERNEFVFLARVTLGIAVEHEPMRQRLDGMYQHSRGEFVIADVYLRVIGEKGRKRCRDCIFYGGELAPCLRRPWRLLEEHAMQRAVTRMQLDHRAHQDRDRLSQRQCLAQRGIGRLPDSSGGFVNLRVQQSTSRACLFGKYS